MVLNAFAPGARALVIGSTGGVGQAVAQAIRAAWGAERVVTLSRSADGLDITKERLVAQAARDQAGPFDLIFVATGALQIGDVAPEKALSAIEPDAMRDLFVLNALGPALVLKHFHHFLPRDRHTVFATLSARVGSVGDNRLGGWIGYRASKAALNQVIRTASVELARTRPRSVCVALHPGTVRTTLTERYLGRHPSVEADEAAANLLRVIGGLTTADTGSFLDWKGETVPW